MSDEVIFTITPEQHKAMVYRFVEDQNKIRGTQVDPEEVWQEVLAGLAEENNE